MKRKTFECHSIYVISCQNKNEDSSLFSIGVVCSLHPPRRLRGVSSFATRTDGRAPGHKVNATFFKWQLASMFIGCLALAVSSSLELSEYQLLHYLTLVYAHNCAFGGNAKEQ